MWGGGEEKVGLQAALAEASSVADFERQRRQLRAEDESPDAEYQRNLQDANQDVDREAVAARLEDPALKAHMESARDRLAEQERRGRSYRLPREVRHELFAGLGVLATRLGELKPRAAEQNQCATQMEVLARHAAALGEGRAVQPFFPQKLQAAAKDPAFKPAMDKLAALMQADAAKLVAVSDFLGETRAKLSSFRDMLIRNLDELVNLCEHQQAVIQDQRKLLAAVRQVTHGEQLREREAIRAVEAESAARARS